MTTEPTYTEEEVLRAMAAAFRAVPVGGVIEEVRRRLRDARGEVLMPPRVRPNDVAELLRKKGSR
ncbi:MAG: hypothetical protein AAGH15_24110 [Myxococcota bacterium]